MVYLIGSFDDHKSHKKKEKEGYGGAFSLEHELMNHQLARQYFLVKKEFHTSNVGLQI